MIEKVYIVRHGYRANWATSTWKNVTGLPRDPPLAALGEKQADTVAEHFLSLPESQRPTAIFSSPFYRCLQTAAPTAKTLGIPLYVEHGIGEWYSPVKPGTGLHPRPSSASVLQTHISQIDQTWSSIWYPARKGETVEEGHDRVGGCLNAMINRLEGGDSNIGEHARILLFSHAATTIAIVRELLGDRQMPLRVGCCTLTEVSRKPGSRGVLGSWCPEVLVSAEHLKPVGGSLMDWGFEDIEIENGKVVDDPGIPGTEGEKDDPVGLQFTCRM